MKPSELVLTVSNLINAGQYSKALSLFQRIEKRFPKNIYVQFSRHAFYIDLGLGIEGPSLVWKGIKSGTKLLKNENFIPSQGSIHYNIANGYSALYTLEKKQDTSKGTDPDYENLKQAKKHFRLAVEKIQPSQNYLLPQLWTNYANCLSHLGRDIEALELYDKALVISPEFPMAVGNKAESLIRFADISGDYQAAIHRTAYQMLKSIIENPDLDRFGGQGAHLAFQKDIEKIESRFSDPSKLVEPLSHPPIDFASLDGFESEYIQFCLDFHLFLNLHIHADACKAAIGDPIFIQLITALDDDHTFSQYASQINQIKEDFVVARLQLFLALHRSQTFDEISELTTFVRDFDTSTFTIFTGLLKGAFKSAFGIMDKVACFVNEYCEVGLDETSIQFSNPDPRCCVWRHGGSIRQHIHQKNNSSLFAIYDIFLDFIGGHYSTFHEIRNALTHRRLIIVHEKRPFDDSGTIGFAEMVTSTIELMQLTRAVIIYLINFVSLETRRTKAETFVDKPIGDLFADSTQIFHNDE